MLTNKRRFFLIEGIYGQCLVGLFDLPARYLHGLLNTLPSNDGHWRMAA